MTRFTRARGSKASNERTPEEATPWSLMKQQLVEDNKKKDHHQNEIISSPFMKKSVKKSVNCSGIKHWECFDTDSKETVFLKKDQYKKSLPSDMNKMKLKHNKVVNNFEDVFVKDSTFNVSLKNKKILNSDNGIRSLNNQMNFVGFDKKKKRSLSVCSDYDTSKINCVNDVIDNNLKDHLNILEKNKICKKSKSFKLADDKVESNIENDKIDIVKIKPKNKNIKNNDVTISKNNFYSGFKNMKTNRRSFPNDKKFNGQLNSNIIVGGKILEIADFQGFPVKKEDAKRLQKLRKDLKLKSVPRKEIEVALKAERRRAEKALAREKKAVCFKCRKFGHNMSECPECDDPSGLCFKCGSTEHSVRECRVVQNESFKFAHCFICQEQGHIARQCPDNPRGLYPKGGACKVCGDVTHLKKDCPELIDEKETNTLTVGTVKDNCIEYLDEDLKNCGNRRNITKKVNFVTF